MTGWAKGVWRLVRRLRNPPIGRQQGRRERFTRMFPLVSWVYYFLIAYTTPRLYLYSLAGLGPVLIFALLGFETRALVLGYILLAWVVTCILAGIWWRPKLAINFEAPLRVECGTAFTLRYRITNSGKRTIRDLTLDTIIFSDWMSLRLPREQVACLPVGTTALISGSGKALARGVFYLPALRYDSSFPGGFWRWGRTLPPERVVSVYPRYTRLVEFAMVLGTKRRQEFSAARELSREALEFHGCREYREGDDLRHVHPRSSARLGVPVIKEFQAEGRSRTALVVDTFMTNALWQSLLPRLGRTNAFEAALSLAAAVVDALSSTDRILELLVIGRTVHHFVTQGRVGYLEEVLDILAAVEGSRHDNFGDVSAQLLGGAHNIESLCLILTGWDAARAEFVEQLKQRDIATKVVVVASGAHRTAAWPAESIHVTPAAILGGEVVQL